MAYRDDLEAAQTRADHAERECRRVEAESQQKITALTTRLGAAERALATGPKPEPLARPARLTVKGARQAAVIGWFVAGAAVAQVAHLPMILVGAGAAVLVVLVWSSLSSATVYRELVESFFRSLRAGDYEDAYARVHRVAQDPEAFSRFCERIEALRLATSGALVRVVRDRWLRRDARVLTGFVRTTDDAVALEATIATDAQGAWRLQDATIAGAIRLRAAREDDR